MMEATRAGTVQASPGAIVPAATAGQLAPLVEKARAYVENSTAENTRRAYAADWQGFAEWCFARNHSPLPVSAEALALYLADQADQVKPSTLQRRLSSLSVRHQQAGHELPLRVEPARSVWRGIKRAKGTAQEGKAPVITAELRRMVETLDRTLLGKRDRALLLLGFAGAFRRSELVSLNREDVKITLEGAAVTLRRSKTDQEGQGTKKGIPYGSNPATCPVRALQAWLGASGIKEGPLFRSVNRHGQLQAGRLSDKAVALVVKRCAEKAGLDPALYAGHSLRAGLVTSAAMAGVSERSIMNTTGHRSERMVRKYVRDGSLFRDNAAAQVGL